MNPKRSSLAPRGRRVVRFRPSEEAVELFDEIAAASGRSRSAVMSEMVDQLVPVLRAQYEAMQRVAETPEKAAEAIAYLAEQARVQIAQAELELQETGGRHGGRGAG